MKGRAWLVAFGLLAIGAIPGPSATIHGALGARMDSLLTAMTRLGTFSGAALVVQDGTVLLSRGYGTVSVRTNTPITPATAFDLGSVSKQFTATAVLALEADGKLRTSDPIARWLPGVPDDKRAITIDHLLHHVSGLPPDVRPSSESYRPIHRDTMVRAVLALPLGSAPESTFRYSNPNYLLLAAIVERASGRPFQRFVHERLLDRAGLRATGFWGEQRLWNADQVARGAWGLYDVGSSRDWQTSWWSLGAGQMISTLPELNTWFEALQSDRVIPAAQRQKLFTPGRGDYACGWYVRKRPDGSTGIIYHAGATDGTGIEVRWYPARKAFVALASNLQLQDMRMSSDAIYFLFEVVRGEPLPAFPASLDPPSTPNRVLGAFGLPGGGRFTLWTDPAGAPWIAPEGQAAFDAFYAWDSSFAVRRQPALDVTGRAIDSLRSARCAPMRWTPPPIPQRLPADWERQWCLDVVARGTIRSIEWIGCAPLTSNDTRTLAFNRIVSERGERVVTWLWEGSDPVESWSDPAVLRPQSVRLAPVASDRYIAYDWFRGHTTGVRIERDTLVIDSPAGPVRAGRVAAP